MEFLVAGMGSMGSTIAAHLKENGETVRAYETNEQIVNEIKSSGLTLRRPGNVDITVDLDITSNPDQLEPVDVIVIMVKSPNTGACMQDLTPVLNDSTDIVTLQNGLSNGDIIANYVPEDQVFSGTTEMGANTIEAGTVKMLGSGTSRIGGINFGRAKQIAERFTDAGMETVAVEDPIPYVWDKQFLSIGIKPIAALTELRNGPMGDFPPTRTLMRELVEEAIAVAQAKDIELISDDPVAHTFDIAERMYEKKSSILEDIEKQRVTEIDYINGAVVDYGDEVGVETPYNRIMTALVKGKELSFEDPTNPEDVPIEKYN